METEKSGIKYHVLEGSVCPDSGEKKLRNPKNIHQQKQKKMK